MGKIKCRVCGFEWTPTKEDHYIARADEKARILVNDHSEPALFDAWDCPVCGAQFAVEGRKRAVEDDLLGPVGIEVRFGGPGSVSIGDGGGGHKNPYEDLDARVQEDCEGCEYVDEDGDEFPCNDCSRAYYDRYRKEKQDGSK